MDGKRKLKRKRVAGGPTLDEFHIILQQLQSPKRKIKFTESAVIGLREVYFEFMKNVASSLSQWDSLKGTSKVEEALGMNKTPEFEQWTEQSQKILSKIGRAIGPRQKRS